MTMNESLLPERIRSKFVPEPNTGCWLWTAGSQFGYGRIWQNDTKRMALAHRVAYEILVGPVPDGLQLDHLCRQRCCVNPAHLEPVTGTENQRRMPREIRKRPRPACRKAFCKHGHAMTPDNIFIYEWGNATMRACCACRVARQKKYDAIKAMGAH